MWVLHRNGLNLLLTMMAFLANGDSISDHFTLVDPPPIGGYTQVQVELTPHLNIPQFQQFYSMVLNLL